MLMLSSCYSKPTSAKFSGARVIYTYIKITTVQELVQGFDQETAAVVMARLTSLKMEDEVLLNFVIVVCILT